MSKENTAEGKKDKTTEEDLVRTAAPAAQTRTCHTAESKKDTADGNKDEATEEAAPAAGGVGAAAAPAAGGVGGNLILAGSGAEVALSDSRWVGGASWWARV